MMIPFKVKTFSFLLACACSTAGMAQVGNDSPVKTTYYFFVLLSS